MLHEQPIWTHGRVHPRDAVRAVPHKWFWWERLWAIVTLHMVTKEARILLWLLVIAWICEHMRLWGA